MHWSSERGHIRVVKAILEAGASVDVLDSDNFTSLMRASIFGHEDVVKCLLAHGADPQFTWNRETALTKAAYFNHPGTLNILLRHGATVDRQHWWTILLAAKEGHIDVARLLIQSGVDVNFRLTTIDKFPWYVEDYVGETALYIAVCNQHASLVTLLVDNGADVNAANDSGETALQYLDRKWRYLSSAEERCLYELCGRKWWRKMWWKSRRVFTPSILFECLATCILRCMVGSCT
jgi:ankyrin repeat protein